MSGKREEIPTQTRAQLAERIRKWYRDGEERELRFLHPASEDLNYRRELEEMMKEIDRADTSTK